MVKITIWLISIYQKTLSLDHGFLGRVVPGGACRFYPTCSQYTKEAIGKYGLIKGAYRGIKRVGRCHPFSKGGFDPLR